MVKACLAKVFMALMFIPAFVTICQAKLVLSHPIFLSDFHPATDTIFVYDTIYEVHFVYDTIFSSDSISQVAIVSSNDTLNSKSDSLAFSKKSFNNGGEGKNDDSTGVIFKSNYSSHLDFNEIKKADELPDPERIETGSSKNSKTEKRLQTEENLTSFRKIPFVFYVKDTLYRADTVVILENLTDTVFYFKLSPRTDTSIYHQTIIEKRQNVVVVNKLVNVNILNKSYVIVDDLRGSQSENFPFWGTVEGYFKNYNKIHESENAAQLEPPKRNSHKDSYKPLKTRTSHRDLGNTSRVSAGDVGLGCVTFFDAGVSLFIPEINFTSKTEISRISVELLNKNTAPQLSYGFSAGMKYYNKNRGFETGLGFSQQRFEFDHQDEIIKIDSTNYWELFNREEYLYDTTWYLDLDEYLSTGNMVFIPSVDSTLTLVADSISKTKTDTATFLVNVKYNYAFSYLEIPLIARYQLIKGKLFCDAAVGLIPSFLIAKSGNILSDENDEIIKTSDLSFDSGFNLAFYGAVTLGYKPSERYALQAEPFIKTTIFTGIENDNISMKSNSWGIKFTVSYCF